MPKRKLSGKPVLDEEQYDQPREQDDSNGDDDSTGDNVDSSEEDEDWLAPPDDGDGEGSGDEDGGQVDGDGDEEEEEEIPVDLDFHDPSPDHYHNVRVLLERYLDGRSFNVSGMADAVVEQKHVGTVVQLADDPDKNVYAVTSALPMRKFKETDWMKSILAYVLESTSDQDARTRLRSALDSGNVALMLTERVANMPDQIAEPLCRGLFDEVAWATEDAEDLAEREAFKVSHFLLLGRGFGSPDVTAGSAASTKKGKKRVKPSPEADMMLPRLEDEVIYSSFAQVKSVWDVKRQWTDKAITLTSELPVKRVAMLFEASDCAKIKAALQSITGTGKDDHEILD